MARGSPASDWGVAGREVLARGSPASDWAVALGGFGEGVAALVSAAAGVLAAGALAAGAAGGGCAAAGLDMAQINAIRLKILVAVLKLAPF